MALSSLALESLRGGLNNSDPPLSLDVDQVVDARNVEWSDGTLAGKRKGSTSFSMTSSSMNGAITALLRYLPSADETATELWAVDSNGHFDRRSGAGWAGGVTLKDAISSNNYDVNGASFNGKLFLAYKSAQDRLHVWDGSTVRRVGLAKPAAPTAADTAGAGTFTGTRYYQVAYTFQSGGVTLRRSERSATLTFAPAGTKTGVTVTKPAAISEGETHWELYASLDNSTFYLVATTVVGTTTVTDTATTYSGNTPYEASTNLNPHSAKYLTVDENRLIFGGSWESTNGYDSTISWTPVNGSLNIGDDERVVETTTVKNRLTLDYGTGGGITGLSHPFNGSVYAFKSSAIYKLVRTGNASVPYDPVRLTQKLGCIRQQTIVEAVDEAGAPALYFLSRQGPCRIGQYGIQQIGSDIRQTWATVNQNALTVLGHGVYHETSKQIYWWVATIGSSTPDLRIRFDTRLGRTSAQGVHRGWVLDDGNDITARCSVMYADTVGATASLDLKPYMGFTSASIRKADTGTTDNGTAFKAYVKTRPLPFGKLKQKCGIESVLLVAQTASGVSVQVALERDFGLETDAATFDLTPAFGETRVIRNADDLHLSEAHVLSITIGDASAIDCSSWQVDQLVVSPRLDESEP